ncbi:MAG: HD domain-containing protein [Gemmatimonadota bacterium]|nr:HD domain-containing protein [Gemmatimonadota bacterium]
MKLRVAILVALVTALAGAVLLLGWHGRTPYPGMWSVVSFTLAAFLLEKSGNDLRFETKGSTSFVVHLAGGILYGPFWGSLFAGLSTVLSEVEQQKNGAKVLFNVAQRVVAVGGGLFLIALLGATFPLFDFHSAVTLNGSDIQRNVLLFFLFAIFYFAFNTVAVSLVVAISGGRRFREVWTLTFRGVLGYDIGASFLALFLAWLYVRFEDGVGIGAVGFAIALAPILLIRHIYGLYWKLQSSGRELLDLMVKAIEARDPYTSGHSVRVASLAKAIAQEAKMSAEEVELVYTAAILHDVGKIHEEFAPLLRKDSKLTPEETALLQTHSVKSADLVGIISGFRGVVQDAVRSHHERWDGGGYPDGLAAEEIPLGARIIMISDTTDAMTTDRPYRKKLPIEAVVSELQKYRGTQFDPRLVDIAVSSMAVRRVMSELQSSQPVTEPKVIEGGSKKVSSRQQVPSWRNRASWPKIRVF